jgi:hypothetical protein
MSTLGPYRHSVPGWKESGRSGQDLDHGAKVAAAQVGVGVLAKAAEAGGMAHQLAHVHRPRLGDRRPVLGLDLQVGKLGDVLGDRVVQRPPVLFPQHHHRRADDRLGHRGDAEDGIGGQWRGFRSVLPAVGVQVGDLAVAGDQRRHAGQLLLVDQGVHLRVERGQAAPGEAGDKRLGGGDGGLVVGRHGRSPRSLRSLQPCQRTARPTTPR